MDIEKIVTFIIKKNIALVAILLVLGIIPFFWFKLGEVNLGGDSSRLYFYDPLNYLKNLALYSIASGQTGYEAVNYFFIPFVALFILLKKIFISPGLVTNIFHSFMLVTAFLFTYLSLVELLRRNSVNNRIFIFFAACIGALFYIFGPPVWNWDKAITSHNQIFLNPLIFFLLLKFFISDNPVYLTVILFISFVFSTNFSYISAPAIFSFYPFALLYLFIYKKYIIQTPFRWKTIIGFTLLFFAIQAFQLVPQISVLLNKTSYEFKHVFTTEGVVYGLDFFTASSQGIKLSKNLAAIVQMDSMSGFQYLLFVFPIIMILGLLVGSPGEPSSKQKFNHLILTFIFLVILFFDTANITNIGFLFYKLLFRLPGFAMFRNFYGQFLYVFTFFYALVLGYSIYAIFIKITKKIRIFLSIALPIILILHGWPFISGFLVKLPVLGSKDVTVPQRVDPDFEKTLEYIRGIPTDAKFLTLPLTDFGYQLLAGTNGGLYMGPSMIGHLAGKNDFMGYSSFAPFQEIFFDRIKHNDYKSVQFILSLLNIRYIFYNSDPYIYDKFPNFPYNTVRKYFSDEESIQDFISHLNVSYQKQYSDKYYIYKSSNSAYLPSIYAATENIYWNTLFMDSVLHDFPVSDNRLAIYNRVEDIAINPNIETLYLKPENNSQYLDLFKQRKSELASPYISRSLISIFYPLVAFKEENVLQSYNSVDDSFIDKSIFYAEKRISELEMWKNEIVLKGGVQSIKELDKNWKEPKLWQFSRFYEYNMWEISLVRYERIIQNLLSKLENNNASKSSLFIVKLDLKSILSNQHRRLINIVRDSNRHLNDKKYLWNIIDAMYEDIQAQLQYSDPSVTNLFYSIEGVPTNDSYEVFLEKEGFGEYTTSDIELFYSGRRLTPQKDIGGQLLSFGEIGLSTESAKPITLNILRPINVAKNPQWLSRENISTDQEGNVFFSTNNPIGSNLSGMTTRITQWQPESYYIISFDYRTFGRSFIVQTYEQDSSANPVTKQLSNDILKSDQWSKYQAVVVSGDNAQSAFINVYYDEERKEVENAEIGTKPAIEVKNVVISRIFNPTIILRKKKADLGSQRDLPSIEFQKINPSRYNIRLTNVRNAFTLVFSQAYNANWNIVNTSADTKSFRGWVSRLIGKMLQFVVSPFVSPTVNKIEEKYYDGDILEKTAQNVFLTKETFDTWGKDAVAKNSHFLVNGYANGWYIKPEDLGGRNDYEFVIELSTQKLFYGNLLISLVTFIGILVMSIFMSNLKVFNNLISKIKDTWYHNMLAWSLRGCHSVLDVGCGASSPLAYAAENRVTEGIDAYTGSIRESKKKKIHDSYRTGDIRKLGHWYPAKSYDAVIALDVIEHLTRKEGFKLISDMEAIARKKIIVMTPNGFYDQEEIGGNKFQVHQSGWNVKDFEKLNFKSFGIRGLKWLRREHATLRYKPWFFWGLFSFISEPILIIFPAISYQIFAVKRIDRKNE